MIILGIDPGLAVTGFGILQNGRTVDYGQINTEAGTPVAERIERIVNQMDRRVRRYKPTACVMETLFFKAVGARSVILAAQVRGGLFYLMARRGIPITEITPATLKLTITGNGRAAKRQIQYMVRTLLGIQEKIPDHAADALAAAYCLAKKIKTTSPPIRKTLRQTSRPRNSATRSCGSGFPSAIPSCRSGSPVATSRLAALRGHRISLVRRP